MHCLEHGTLPGFKFYTIAVNFESSETVLEACYVQLAYLLNSIEKVLFESFIIHGYISPGKVKRLPMLAPLSFEANRQITFW